MIYRSSKAKIVIMKYVLTHMSNYIIDRKRIVYLKAYIFFLDILYMLLIRPESKGLLTELKDIQNNLISLQKERLYTIKSKNRLLDTTLNKYKEDGVITLSCIRFNLYKIKLKVIPFEDLNIELDYLENKSIEDYMKHA